MHTLTPIVNVRNLRLLREWFRSLWDSRRKSCGARGFLLDLIITVRSPCGLDLYSRFFRPALFNS